jgi:signal transduction histidine kinase
MRHDAVGQGEATARLRRSELLFLLLTRVAALVNVAAALVTAGPGFRAAHGILVLASAVAAESLLLIVLCYRAGYVSRRYMSADVIFLIAAMVANAAMTNIAGMRTWGFFMYPFSIVAAIVYGVAYRRFGTALTIGCGIAASYVVASVHEGRIYRWDVLPNAVTFPLMAAVGWFLTREIRRSAASADDSRARAEPSAAALASARERERQARALHDRVLQSLESLARGDWKLDPVLQAQLRSEASWLRRFVETGETTNGGGLLAELHTLAAQAAYRGLHVDVNARSAAGMPGLDHMLEQTGREALVGAAAEALANVAKHAGVAAAVVHVAADARGVAVTVNDAGYGFDPARVTGGVGIERSIRRRLTEAGGTARVSSSPVEGTQVELWMPSAAFTADAEQE